MSLEKWYEIKVMLIEVKMVYKLWCLQMWDSEYESSWLQKVLKRWSFSIEN